jgi:alpha-N-arabinofuranosidase
VTCTGHADFVQAADGSWWSVFLGCRPYEGNDFDTGRETFMLPVNWKDGWPTILPDGVAVPYVVRGPAGAGLRSSALTGNGTTRYDFAGGNSLPPELIMLRRPSQAWWSMDPVGHLSLVPGRDTLSGRGNPSFIAHRLQHARFESTLVVLPPSDPGVSAGLAVFQNEEHHYFLGVRRALAGGLEIFVEDREGAPTRALAAFRDLTDPVELRIAGDGAVLRFSYHTGTDVWVDLGGDFDATVLSTRAAGGFVGSVIGPYARIDSP